MKLPNTYTPEEAAKLLQIGERRMLNMLRSDEFPSAKIGAGTKRFEYVIYPEHIEAYRQKVLIQSGFGSPAPIEETPAQATPSRPRFLRISEHA